MNLKRLLEKVEKYKFSEKQVKKLLEHNIQNDIKYGTVLFILLSMGLLAIRDEKEYGHGSKESEKWIDFSCEWEARLIKKYDFDREYLVNMNSYLIDNFRPLIMKYCVREYPVPSMLKIN